MTRRVMVGGVQIGGGAPISVQSMTTTQTSDIAATVAQIARLEAAGCEIVRVAVPDMAAAEALPAIRKAISIPLVADIHFDHRLALAAIRAGVDKLRLNPGNITDPAHIAEVAEAAAKAEIPIRVGANSGSLAPLYLDAHGRASAAGMVESALHEIRILERQGFEACDLGDGRGDVRRLRGRHRLNRNRSAVADLDSAHHHASRHRPAPSASIRHVTAAPSRRPAASSANGRLTSSSLPGTRSTHRSRHARRPTAGCAREILPLAQGALARRPLQQRERPIAP